MTRLYWTYNGKNNLDKEELDQVKKKEYEILESS
jgi:hypothetical protein